jgi:hypothetical protein
MPGGRPPPSARVAVLIHDRRRKLHRASCVPAPHCRGKPDDPSSPVNPSSTPIASGTPGSGAARWDCSTAGAALGCRELERTVQGSRVWGSTLQSDESESDAL